MVDRIQLNGPSLLSALSGTSQANGSKTEPSDPFKGLNLDSWNLSDDAKSKITWAKAQFEANFQVIRSLNTANGVETIEQRFSFQAGYEFLERVSGRDAAASFLGGPSNPGRAETTSEAASAETSNREQDALTKLREYFSPEKTAERILDVAMSFFPHSSASSQEGTPETQRQAFATFIGGAIEEGFRQARTLLGPLPEEVSGGIDTTHDLVFTGLEEFVKNGVNPEKMQPGGVFDKIAAYRNEGTANTERLRAASQGNYTAKGDLTGPEASPTIFTKG